MKLEQQVCTLEQAKRLKELGVAQGSYFHWQHFPKTIYRNECLCVIGPGAKECVTDPGECWSAFTVAELGHMLSGLRYQSYGFPMVYTSYCHSDDHTADLLGTWSCSFRNPRNFKNPDLNNYDSEAEARAAMLIYLLENNIAVPSEVNARLNS